METERYKMREFLGKLWMNPALQKTSIDKKENQVLSFLRENQPQLQKIFSQTEYFPNLTWNEAVTLLLTELVDKLLETIIPKIDYIYKNMMSPSVIQSLEIDVNIDAEKFKTFLIEQMRVKAMRDHYLSAIQVISLNYYANYIPEAIERHKYIYNEFMRHDKLKMDPQALITYLSITTLFRPLFHFPVKALNGSNEITGTLAKSPGDKKSFEMMLNSLRDILETKIGKVPEMIFMSGIQSNLMLSDFPDISGVAKFIAVISARSADYIPMEKKDRGAESPDKSWFQINRRNSKIYGLDQDILDELYQIAGEKGW
ncbi:MAG: hypothetical protein OEV78_07325 [Spirochaetia bacterium]|nr:hypothetical protein [Spirochaetia bacterium]